MFISRRYIVADLVLSSAAVIDDVGRGVLVGRIGVFVGVFVGGMGVFVGAAVAVAGATDGRSGVAD